MAAPKLVRTGASLVFSRTVEFKVVVQFSGSAGVDKSVKDAFKGEWSLNVRG